MKKTSNFLLIIALLIANVLQATTYYVDATGGNDNNSEVQNNVYENTINAITDIAGFNALQGTSGYQIADNIADDPLFVDVINSDFHLSGVSTCIDSGTTTLATVDFEGNTIPFNETNPDIGIYEYQNYMFRKNQARFYQKRC